MLSSASPPRSETLLWRRAQTLLARALELPPSRRGELIDGECGSQPTLAGYIRMLLEKNSDGPDWLEEGPELDGSPLHMLSDGEVLAERFEVVCLLGSGGMSEVYKVRDPWTSRELALKLLLPELTERAETILRIQHEFLLAKRVAHPNVCRLDDISRHGDPEHHDRVLHFITMELLEGVTLAQYLRDNGPLSPARALEFLEQIVAALMAAHSAGVIHRDLKPGNLMVTQTAGGQLRIVITDFGMAVPVSESTPGRLARGRLVGGTPRYMAPEQYTTDEATPATDVFALGVIVHEMLTGATPFEASRLTTLIENSTSAPGRAIAVANTVPHRWANAILRCLEPAPENRFQSADALLNAVRPRRRGRLARRVALLFIPGSAAAWWYAVRNRPDPPATTNDDARAAFARASLQGKRLTAEELRKSVANYEQALRLDPRYAEAWAGLAECYGRLQDYGGLSHREAATRAQAAAAKSIELKPGLAQAHAALGLSLSLDVDRWKLAGASFDRALSLRPDYASAHHWLGMHLARTGDIRDGLKHLEQAVRAEPDSLTALNAFGFLLYFAGRYREAMRAALTAIDLDQNSFYPHLLLARCHEALGDYTKALEICDVAARLSTRGPLGTRLAMPPVVLSAEACIYASRHETGKARARLYELQRRQAAEAIPVYYIATVHCALGEKRAAIDLLERALLQRDPGVLFVRLYPQFRILADEPRYRALLAQIGFAPDSKTTASTATG